ncbi:MAG TPA: FAD-dependent oxidoreductase [Phycisphaerae bacterium]|nr:FAD-dependent oxidoreductase [Phycisphaerae bacterium]
MVCDILIVGAGFAGATTAYHLRKLALDAGDAPPRILILEKEAVPGEHSSGRNAALIRRLIDDPVIAEIANRSADVLARCELAEFHRTGSLLIDHPDARNNAADRVPIATGRALWCPDDGVMDIAGLLSAYLKDQDIRFNTEVIDWTDAPQRAASDRATPDAPPLLRVRTNKGSLVTRLLVNAAGPWAGRLGDLPVSATTRHLFVTPPMEGVRPDWPWVWNEPERLYFRPESGGLLLCACDESPAEPGRYDEDPAVRDSLDGLVRELQPRLGELRIMRSWAGHRTFADDRRFVIGHDPRDRRIFHVAALGGQGVSTSAAVGPLAANLLLHPDTPQDNPFTPTRLL